MNLTTYSNKSFLNDNHIQGSSSDKTLNAKIFFRLISSVQNLMKVENYQK